MLKYCFRGGAKPHVSTEEALAMGELGYEPSPKTTPTIGAVASALSLCTVKTAASSITPAPSRV